MAPAPSLQDLIQLVETEAGDEQPISRLRVASALVRNLAEVGDAALGYFVDRARHAGHSWSEIGEALGVSKQAAQQKQSVRVSAGVNPPTFERFTPRARNVVGAAEPIAREWGHGFVGTEHLLLALYREPQGLAAQILADAGLSEDKATAAVGGRAERGAGAPEGRLPFTPHGTAVFSGALAAALEMGHNYIGTEHLLIGLARGGGIAGDVLSEAGLSEDLLRQRTTEKLTRYIEAGRPKRPPSRRAPSKPAAPRGKRGSG